ncbi:MAG: organic hydroperoxide resistance protein [Maritimibacter sp.]|jgi:lipoyl-dependent peroxiredoxin
MSASKILYQTAATATGGRDGHARTADGAFEAKLVTPKELGGPGGDGVNPEQLFATGYAACFLSALKFVAAHQKQALPADAAVTTKVGIGPRAEGGFGLTVEIEVSLPGIEPETGETLIAAAHNACPYSNATRGSLDITPVLV